MDRGRCNTNSYSGHLAFGTVGFATARRSVVHIISAIGVIPRVLIADAISSKFAGCLAMFFVRPRDERGFPLRHPSFRRSFRTLVHFVTGRWEQFDISFGFVHDVYSPMLYGTPLIVVLSKTMNYRTPFHHDMRGDYRFDCASSKF